MPHCNFDSHVSNNVKHYFMCLLAICMFISHLYVFIGHQYDTTFMAESKEELKNLLMKVKEESEKVVLKLNIQETKIVASDTITSWHIDGETMETVADFILGAPKSLQMVTSVVKLKDTYSLEGKL